MRVEALLDDQAEDDQPDDRLDARRVLSAAMLFASGYVQDAVSVARQGGASEEDAEKAGRLAERHDLTLVVRRVMEYLLMKVPQTCTPMIRMPFRHLLSCASSSFIVLHPA